MNDLKRFNILVVEDDEFLRVAIVTLFEDAGFTVLEASGGRDAFGIVASSRIDLVVSDMQMPNGNGIELLESIRAKDPKIPIVVFVTGHSDVTEKACLEKGAKKVFGKPFNDEELLNCVIGSLVS